VYLLIPKIDNYVDFVTTMSDSDLSN